LGENEDLDGGENGTRKKKVGEDNCGVRCLKED
jgi:hypothetical protein